MVPFGKKWWQIALCVLTLEICECIPLNCAQDCCAKRLVLSPCKAAAGNAFLLGSCCSDCFSVPAWFGPLAGPLYFQLQVVRCYCSYGCLRSALEDVRYAHGDRCQFQRTNGSPSFFAVLQRPLDDMPSTRRALPHLIRKSFCRSKTAEYFLIEPRLGSQLDLLDRVAP